MQPNIMNRQTKIDEQSYQCVEKNGGKIRYIKKRKNGLIWVVFVHFNRLIPLKWWCFFNIEFVCIVQSIRFATRQMQLFWCHCTCSLPSRNKSLKPDKCAVQVNVGEVFAIENGHNDETLPLTKCRRFMHFMARTCSYWCKSMHRHLT